MRIGRRMLLAAAGAAGALAAAPAARAAAPFQGGQVQGFYRFRLGAFECTVLSDGWTSLDPHPTFATNGTAEEVAQALRTARRATDAVPVDFNCLLVNTGQQLVLIDPDRGRTGPSARTPGGCSRIWPPPACSRSRSTSSPTPMPIQTTVGAPSRPTAPRPSPTLATPWGRRISISGPPRRRAPARSGGDDGARHAQRAAAVGATHHHAGRAGRGGARHPGAGRTRPFPWPYRLPHRKRGPSAAGAGGYGQPLCPLAGPAGLAFRL